MGTTAIDDAAATAAAEKEAADKATADSAAAEKAAAEKAAADQAAAEKAKAEQLTAIKSVLKLPDNAAVDAAVTERIAAIASERGLTPEVAQTMLDVAIQEATSHGTRAIDALKAALQPGGAEWQKQVETWNAAALADPALGGGKPDQLTANVDLAKRVLAKFGGTPEQVAALEQSGLVNNPDALRILVGVGKAMKEDSLVVLGAAGAERTEQDRLNVLYPSMVPKVPKA